MGLTAWGIAIAKKDLGKESEVLKHLKQFAFWRVIANRILTLSDLMYLTTWLVSKPLQDSFGNHSSWMLRIQRSVRHSRQSQADKLFSAWNKHLCQNELKMSASSKRKWCCMPAKISLCASLWSEIFANAMATEQLNTIPPKPEDQPDPRTCNQMHGYTLFGSIKVCH